MWFTHNIIIYCVLCITSVVNFCNKVCFKFRILNITILFQNFYERCSLYMNIMLYYNSRCSTEHKLSVDYDWVCLTFIIYQCSEIPYCVNNVKTCSYIYFFFNKLVHVCVCVCVCVYKIPVYKKQYYIYF